MVCVELNERSVKNEWKDQSFASAQNFQRNIAEKRMKNIGSEDFNECMFTFRVARVGA